MKKRMKEYVTKCGGEEAHATPRTSAEEAVVFRENVELVLKAKKEGKLSKSKRLFPSAVVTEK